MSNRQKINNQLDEKDNIRKKAKSLKPVSFAPITGHMQTTRKVKTRKTQLHGIALLILN